MSLYSLTFEQTLWDGKIMNPTRLGGVTLSMSAAYMLADAVSMPIYWRDYNLLVFWLHHGIAATCFVICSSQGVLHFFALFRLMSEMSTPFLNVNWHSRLCRVSRGSLLSLVNSLCLTATYILCRIAVIPLYWYYFLHSGADIGFRRLADERGVVCLLWLSSSLTLDILNVYWGKKILLGGVRTAKLGLEMRGIRL